MLARNYSRKHAMNVNDIIQDNVPDRIYSSVLFTLVNLPYRDKSIDIEAVIIDGKEYKCYKNHYRFDNGTMMIVKIASLQFVPYGIYARKIINWLIAEYTYKQKFPQYYDTNESQRMICLGRKPIDFIEKICGTRKVGSNTRVSILKQLEALLNCHMAIATGYKQINPKNDEALASDRHQFALIESCDEQLINHQFDLLTNWQEEIYISQNLADILSQHIMPLDKDVYNQINSPMELDQYQYFMYQNYNCLRRNDKLLKYNFDQLIRLFGRGYAKTSQGKADFKREFIKNLNSLLSKTQLLISATSDSKYLIFKPSSSLLLVNSSDKLLTNAEIEQDLYLTFKAENDINDAWKAFASKYSITEKFDANAVKLIKQTFDINNNTAERAVQYTLENANRNPSAFVKDAINGNWAQKYDEFNQRLIKWKDMVAKLSKDEASKIKEKAYNACNFLQSKYAPEKFSIEILSLIYMRFFYHNKDIKLTIDDLDGTKFQQLFKRHQFELLDCYS